MLEVTIEDVIFLSQLIFFHPINKCDESYSSVNYRDDEVLCTDELYCHM